MIDAPESPADGMTTADFLAMREQNMRLLDAAIAFVRPHTDKAADPRSALALAWQVYSEFYQWIDPSDDEPDDEAPAIPEPAIEAHR